MTPELKARIESEIAKSPVTVFMKGTRDFPMCGFSARVAQMFEMMGVAFNDVNVLEDMDLREGVKEFTQWPTIPQIYIGGEFIGGCDIAMEMMQSGELQQKVQAVLAQSA